MSILQNLLHQVLPQIQVPNNQSLTQRPSSNNSENNSFRPLLFNDQRPPNLEIIPVNENSYGFLPTSRFTQSTQLTSLNLGTIRQSEGLVQLTQLRTPNTQTLFNQEIFQTQQHLSQGQGLNVASYNIIRRQNQVNYLEDALYSSQLHEYQYQLYQAQMSRNGIRLYSAFQIPFLNGFNDIQNQPQVQIHQVKPGKGGRKKKFKLMVMKQQEECSICLLNMKINARVPKLKCLHKFHKKCLEGWMIHKKNCPMCRLAV